MKGGQKMKEVGATGFEPATPTTPKWCATKLRYAPTEKDRQTEIRLFMIVRQKPVGSIMDSILLWVCLTA